MKKIKGLIPGRWQKGSFRNRGGNYRRTGYYSYSRPKHSYANWKYRANNDRSMWEW